MLDMFDMFTIGGLTGAFSSVLSFFSIVLVTLIFLIPLMFIFFIMGYKHQVTVRHLTGGKIIITRDRARIVKDKLGVKKLKLLNTPKFMKGERISLPPDEATNTTKKGQIHADVYRTQQGQYIWCVDRGLEKEVKLEKNAKEDNFEPLNTMDRSFYASEWEEAEKYKTKSIGEIIMFAAPWFVIFLMFTMLVINWDIIAAPALESQKISAKQQQVNLQIQQELQKTVAIMKGIQIPEDKENKENG